MTTGDSDDLQSRFFWFESQQVTLEDFPASGLILDIGGGGEGIIGRLKGSQVVAIDRLRCELEDAPAGPLKIIMDARELQFLDGTFNTATAFFSFMFIPPADHASVLGEVYRVLAPGGRLLLWDFDFPTCQDPQRDLAAFELTVCLPGHEEIHTGYGSGWPEARLNLQHYRDLAEQAGFITCCAREDGRVFYLELHVPSAGDRDRTAVHG